MLVMAMSTDSSRGEVWQVTENTEWRGGGMGERKTVGQTLSQPGDQRT